MLFDLITATKIRQKIEFPNFFLTFLYKMLREWYYKSLSVRMEIITYNFIIIFCHLVEVAIFAVGDFFSLFGIAVFYVPITHKLCFLLFLMQRYNLFSYLQIFFNFFYCLLVDLSTKTNLFYAFPCSSLCRRWCSGPGPDRESWWLFTHNHTHAHTYARTRTRTGIFR